MIKLKLLIIISVAILVPAYAEARPAEQLHFELDKKAALLLRTTVIDKKRKDLAIKKKNLFMARIKLIKATQDDFPIIKELNTKLTRAYNTHKVDKKNVANNTAYFNARLRLRAKIVSTLRNSDKFNTIYNEWVHANMVLEDDRVAVFAEKDLNECNQYREYTEDLQEIRLGILGD